MSRGIEMIAAELYKDEMVTLKQASRMADVTVREMIDILLNGGIRGNVRLDHQMKTMNLPWNKVVCRVVIKS